MAEDKFPPIVPSRPPSGRGTSIRPQIKKKRALLFNPPRGRVTTVTDEIKARETRKQLEEAFARLEVSDYCGRGLASLKAGALIWASSFFKKAMDVDANNLSACYGYGLVLIGMHKPQEAIALFSHLRREHPDDAFALYWLARAYAHQGRTEAANKVYDAAFNLDPELAQYHRQDMQPRPREVPYLGIESFYYSIGGKNLRDTGLDWPSAFHWADRINLGDAPIADTQAYAFKEANEDNTTINSGSLRDISEIENSDETAHYRAEGRAVGGTETPAAQGMHSANARGGETREEHDSVDGVVDALRSAIGTVPAELLKRNIMTAIDASREGISIADAFTKAGGALRVLQTQGGVEDERIGTLSDSAPSLTEEQRRDQLPEMDEEDLRQLAKQTKANPWSPQFDRPPSEFISVTYKEWLGKKRLMRKHLVEVAPKLMMAYATEIRRHSERRLKDLGERIYTHHGALPKRLPKAPSNKWVPTAELDEEQQHARRLLEAKKKRDQRGKKEPKRLRKGARQRFAPSL